MDKRIVVNYGLLLSIRGPFLFVKLSKKHLVKNGTFLIYKAKLLDEEIEAFKKKYQKAKFEIIPYNLPLEETFERSLVILK